MEICISEDFLNKLCTCSFIIPGKAKRWQVDCYSHQIITNIKVDELIHLPTYKKNLFNVLEIVPLNKFFAFLVKLG